MYLPVPSLEGLATVPVAGEFWKKAVFGTESSVMLWRQMNSDQRMETSSRIQEYAAHEVSESCLPPGLKGELTLALKTVHLEAFRWLCSWEGRFVEDVLPDVVRHLRWTGLGAVDTQQTAKLLVTEPGVEIEKRFILACVYCMEEEIRRLWPQVDTETLYLIYRSCEFFQDVVLYWIDILSKRTDRKRCYNFFSPTGSYRLSQLLPMTKYFFPHYTARQKNHLLNELSRTLVGKFSDYSWNNLVGISTLDKNLVDIFGFLVCEMNPEQRLALFRRNGHLNRNILESFLFFLRLDLFMSSLQVISNVNRLLSNNDYVDIAVTVVKAQRRMADMPQYKQSEVSLLHNFWDHSSDSHKTYATNEGLPDLLMCVLYQNTACEFLDFFLQKTPAAAKTRWIFSQGTHCFFVGLISLGNWRITERVLTQFLISRDQVATFKAKFKPENDLQEFNAMMDKLLLQYE